MSMRHTLRLALMTTALTALPALGQEGFAISIGGETVAGEDRLADSVRRVEPAFTSSADVRVTADGLGVRPRLDLEVVSASPGSATVRSRTNYPGWIARAEVVVYDLDAPGGRTLGIYPIDANGEATLALPADADPAAVLRVYDAAGRYDETALIGLTRVHASAEEEGIDRTARRGIPVTGGAVTVSGSGLAPGAVVSALGETIRPDADGSFVIQRILPVGDATIPVRVTGGGENIAISPVISIPQTEWFTVATADLTFGKTLSGPAKGDTWDRGRLAFYTKGKTATGWAITSSADTGEEPLDDLFRDFDRKDPLRVIARLDPELAYPTYGDDSEIIQDAPTDGKFYLRVEREGSYLMWDNAKAPIDGAEYLRNERSLYGFSGLYTSPQQTARGEPRVTFGAYAAHPDQLPGREVFLGTGGSVYFLRRQDISIGSETLTIERRDPDTGRVIERRTLVEGRDYTINYMQGVVTLSAPLSGGTTGGGPGTGTITPAPGTTPESRLVVQYEYTPTAGEVDGLAYGGRAQVWVTDDIRLGITGMVEQTDIADQTATGADLRWVIGQDSWVEAEYARSEGPGFGTDYSADGGLTIATGARGGGTGDATRIEARLAFADLGLAAKGSLGVWAERRSAGFSTLDHDVTADEDLAGIEAEGEVTDRLSYRIRADHYRNADGKRLDEALLEASWKATDRLTWSAGIMHEDRNDPADADDNGRRTDLAVKASFQQSDSFAWYVFGQTTLDVSGALDRNDRAGLGTELAFGNGWTVEAEVSGGTAGAGGRALVSYERDGSSAYLGYELDPGRELDGVTQNGRDDGRVVAGARRPIGDDLRVFGENTYDMFGTHKALTSTYGVEYDVTSALTFTGALDVGQVRDSAGDFDRRGLSFGVRYDDGGGLTAKGRIEVIRDRGTRTGVASDADTVLLTGAASYKIDDARRLIFTVDAADTQSNGTSIPDGEYARVSLGYAFRPVDNDRLNFLARYTYLHDMYGQRVDGTDDPGPRQKSHVLSLDVTYDVGPHWTLGGKLGLRLSESAPDATTPLAKNDAALFVLNARYHLTHEWDLLVEGRYLEARDAGLSETGALATVYRHIGPHAMLGLGYNFGSFSDDLTDLTTDDEGIFIYLLTQF